MKKIVYRFLLTTSFVILCGLIEAATFCRKDLNLNGDIYAVEVKEFSFYMEFGELKKGEVKNIYYTFFYPNGNVFIDSLQNKKMYKRYNYDAHNNIIEEMRIIIGGVKRQVGNTEFSYNDTTNYYSYSYDYGVGGQIKEIKKYGKGLTLIQKIICKKNATEERLEYWNRSNIDKILITTATSRITKLYSDFNDYRSPTGTIIEKLNKKGLPIKTTIEVVGGLVKDESLYIYDEHNNVINGTSKIRNALGEGENKITTYKYDYDKMGNWIRKLQFQNGKLKTWTERTIYYASSPVDYNKIVEREQIAIETTKGRLLKEKHCLDSIQNIEKEEAVRKKQYEDSLVAKKQFYDEMDRIIERELLFKHITATYDFNTASYKIKLYDLKNKIRECYINGSTIEFIEKKGTPSYLANMHEYRVCRYYWDWDASHKKEQIIAVWYSHDLSDMLLYIPATKTKGAISYPTIVALHKNNNNYIAYEIEKDAFDRLKDVLSNFISLQMNNLTSKYLKWNKKIDIKW